MSLLDGFLPFIENDEAHLIELDAVFLGVQETVLDDIKVFQLFNSEKPAFLRRLRLELSCMMVVEEVVERGNCFFNFFLILVLEVGLGLERADSICFALRVDVSEGHLVLVLVCLNGGLEIAGASGVDELEILGQSHAQIFFDFVDYLIPLALSFCRLV